MNDHINRDVDHTTRVLHIFGQMNRGGAEMRTLDVMREINREQFQLIFCVLSGLPGDLDDEIRELGGEVHYCRLDAKFPVRFMRLLKSEKIDVVHSHVFYSSGFVTVLAKIAGVPTRITHFRSTGAGSQERLIRKARNGFLRTLIDLSATHILAVSKGAMEACWTRFRSSDDRCKVVYNGIEVDRYRNVCKEDQAAVQQEFGLEGTSPLFIHVGRFNRAKNHERLIEIFGLVAQQCPKSVLLLVGGGDPEREKVVRALVKAKGLQEKVIFAGVRSDVSVLLSLSDCMMFPSCWEGLPGAVLEAVAMGVPVVGSDIPGMVEISEYTPLIKTIALRDSNEVWSTEALKALVKKNDAESFPSGTPFDMVNAVSALSEVWSGANKKVPLNNG